MASNSSLTGVAGEYWKMPVTGNSIQNAVIGSDEMAAGGAAGASLMPGNDFSAAAEFRTDTVCWDTGDRKRQNPQMHSMQQ